MNIADVTEHGAVVSAHATDGVRILVTAGEDTLVAWKSTDAGVTWGRVACRAGGAALFEDAMDLVTSAEKWLKELVRTGRVK